MSRSNSRSERYLEETITYTDQRTGERKRNTRVRRLEPWEQESGYSDGQQGAAWMRSLRGEDARNNDSTALVSRRTEDQQLATTEQQDLDDDVESYRRRRVEKTRYHDHRSGRSDSGGRPRRREQQQQQSQSHRKREENNTSQKAQKSNRSTQNTNNEDKGNFLSRNFDSSFDGLLSAAAGAGIGAIGGRAIAERTDEGRKKYSTVTGAVAGALAFNFVENKAAEWMREKEEEEDEKKDVNMKKTAMQDCLEAAAVAPG